MNPALMVRTLGVILTDRLELCSLLALFSPGILAEAWRSSGSVGQRETPVN